MTGRGFGSPAGAGWEAVEMERGKSGKKAAAFKKWLPVYLMMMPALIYLFINNYLPMLGIVIAFKKINFKVGIWNSPWAGLENFKYLFTTPDAFIITRNTICYNVAFMIVNTLLGVLFAIFICDITSAKAKKVYQSAILLPYLMSWVIVSYIVYALFSAENGMVNNTILTALGKDKVSWYMEPKYWPAILIAVNTWKGIGYGCMIYISGINGIDPSLLEAAQLDGAGKLRRIRHIILPFLVPSIITLTLLSIGRIFYSDFGLFLQVPMDSGTLYPTTNVIDTYVYRGLLKRGDISMSSAAGVYQSLVGFVLVLGSNLIVRKIDSDKALF